MKQGCNAAYLLATHVASLVFIAPSGRKRGIEEARDDKLPRCPGESSISRSPFSAG